MKVKLSVKMTKMRKVDLMRRPNKALWRFNDLRPHLFLRMPIWAKPYLRKRERARAFEWGDL